MDIYEPSNAAPAMTDLDADGLLDLVIGNLAGGVRCYKQTIPTAISEAAAIDPRFTFYPNPVKQELTIDFNEASISGVREINIYNVIGKKIKQLKTRSKKQIVNLDGIPAGSYIISVNHKGNIISQKFIKQ